MLPVPAPITVVEPCPCYLAQGINKLETLLALPGNEPVATKELKKHLQALRADYEKHIKVWREQYALNMMELCKQTYIQHNPVASTPEVPLQTSAWKYGDSKRLLEVKKKKSKRLHAPAEQSVYVPGAPAAAKRAATASAGNDSLAN